MGVLAILRCLKARAWLYSEIGGAVLCRSTVSALSPGPCRLRRAGVGSHPGGSAAASPGYFRRANFSYPTVPPIPLLGEGGHRAGCVPLPAAPLLPRHPCLAAARDKNSLLGGLCQPPKAGPAAPVPAAQAGGSAGPSLARAALGSARPRGVHCPPLAFMACGVGGRGAREGGCGMPGDRDMPSAD